MRTPAATGAAEPGRAMAEPSIAVAIRPQARRRARLSNSISPLRATRLSRLRPTPWRALARAGALRLSLPGRRLQGGARFKFGEVVRGLKGAISVPSIALAISVVMPDVPCAAAVADVVADVVASDVFQLPLSSWAPHCL